MFIFEDEESILLLYLVLWIGSSLQLEKISFWSWPTLMMENPTLPIVSFTGMTYLSGFSSICCISSVLFNFYLLLCVCIMGATILE